MKTIVALTLLFFSSSSFASQCLSLSHQQAKMSLRALMDAQKIQILCESCEGGATEGLKVIALGFQKTSEADAYQVHLNGQAVDTAFTYVNGINLASLIHCRTQGVAEFIRQ